MTPYRKGYNFECKVKKDLERHGWLVTAARGSHGAWDLKCVAPGPQVILIQCKLDGKMSLKDRIALCQIAAAWDCLPILAYRDSGIQYSRIEGDGYKDWVPE